MVYMQAEELIKNFINFFKSKSHKEINSSSLIPEHDPTVLFTTAGMHPLVPFLLGQKHPAGKRLVNVQKCIRTSDIELVGTDSFHLSFFEMLGNWSLGDYWKEDAIKYSYEFLTKILKIAQKDLYITLFKGNKDAPKDAESEKLWLSLGIPKEHIYFYGKEDNWWGPAGLTGPCGPDTEIFIDTGLKKCSSSCKPGCKCGKYYEIWNDVFMQYNKTKEGKYTELKQKNVDTGMGVERTIAILQKKKSVYETELFAPIINYIKNSSKSYNETSARIIADHIKASVFILGDENSVTPSNVDQGYILRRFIRRSIRHAKLLKLQPIVLQKIAKIIINIYKARYPLLKQKEKFILEELKKEGEKFSRTLEKGINKFTSLIKDNNLTGKEAFLLYQSYGFPLEMTLELAKENNLKLNQKDFEKEFKNHQEISRKGIEKKFKGGLSDSSKETIKLHTASHLLLYAIRKILKVPSILQRGSNITPERLRFDFNFDRKLTEQELKHIESLVNELIKKKIPVIRKEMTVDEAKKSGAKTPFTYKTNTVSVYIIKDCIEICMGPHVQNTSELGHFKIQKEESSSAGVRRIRAVLL